MGALIPDQNRMRFGRNTPHTTRVSTAESLCVTGPSERRRCRSTASTGPLAVPGWALGSSTGVSHSPLSIFVWADRRAPVGHICLGPASSLAEEERGQSLEIKSSNHHATNEPVNAVHPATCWDGPGCPRRLMVTCIDLIATAS